MTFDELLNIIAILLIGKDFSLISPSYCTWGMPCEKSLFFTSSLFTITYNFRQNKKTTRQGGFVLAERRGCNSFALALLVDRSAMLAVPNFAQRTYKTVHRTVLFNVALPLRVRIPSLKLVSLLHYSLLPITSAKTKNHPSGWFCFGGEKGSDFYAFNSFSSSFKKLLKP